MTITSLSKKLTQSILSIVFAIDIVLAPIFFYKYVGICTPFILHTNEMPFQRHQTCMRTQIQTQLHWLIPNSHRPLRAKKKSLLFLSLFMLVKYMWANITPTSTLPIVSSLKRNSRLLVYVMWMTNAGEKKKHARQKTFVLPVKKVLCNVLLT